MSMQKPQSGTPESTSKPRNRTIAIEGMKGDECVSKVNTALKGVKDISVDEVRVGTAKLRAATSEEVRTACAAIKEAGFESRESLVPKASTA